MIFDHEFDHITILPRHSELTSRKEIDLSTDYGGGLLLSNPLVSAPMSSVTGFNMALEMAVVGGIGCLHRYVSDTKMIENINDITVTPGFDTGFPVLQAISSKQNLQLDILLRTKVSGLMIDVAHGDTKASLDLVKYIRATHSDVPIISGNIVTESAASALAKAGITAFRVGIGAGHACVTRKVSGIGRNQLKAINEIYSVGLPILACGGIRNSGDIVKCLAAGASGVIIGRLFSTTTESSAKRFSGKVVYAGMASYFAEEERAKSTGESRESFRQGAGNEVTYEGEHQFLEETGSLRDTVHTLCGGIRAGLAYLGVKSIRELHNIKSEIEWETVHGQPHHF